MDWLITILKFIAAANGIALCAFLFTMIADGMRYAESAQQLRYGTLGNFIGLLLAIAIGVMWP